MKEEPEAPLSAKNVQFKCPDCDRVEQVTYVGGLWTGLVQSAH